MKYFITATSCAVVCSLPIPAELLQQADGDAGRSQETASALQSFREEQQLLEASLAGQFRLPEADEKKFNALLKRAFDSACACLVEDHAALLEQASWGPARLL